MKIVKRITVHVKKRNIYHIYHIYPSSLIFYEALSLIFQFT